MKGGGGRVLMPKQQAVAALDQAAPVNGTFYTVLDTTINARIIVFAVEVATVGETLEGKITIDGQVITVTAFAAANDTPYFCIISSDPAVGTLGPYFSATNPTNRSFMLESRSIKIEVRKTTAAGAGNLKASVWYQTF